MEARRRILCLVVAATLAMGWAGAAFAEGPTPEAATGDVQDAIADGVGAELLPELVEAHQYALPEKATWEEVSKLYEKGMKDDGWVPEEMPAATRKGVNGLSWSKGDLGFDMYFIPRVKGQQPGLIILRTEPDPERAAGDQADDQGAAEGEEGMAYREIADCPCCEKVEKGIGGVWVQNYRGAKGHADLAGPETAKVDLAARTDDGPGCAFVKVKQGKYHVEMKDDAGWTGSDDVEVEDGKIVVAALAVTE
jgi:hypothetical protein